MPGFNLPAHVSARDFDDHDLPTRDCPKCGAEDAAQVEVDFDGVSAYPCDECSKKCACCAEPAHECGKLDAEGWCPLCRQMEEK